VRWRTPETVRLEGDAESGLRWFDESGALLGSDRAPRGGSGEEPRAGPGGRSGLSPEAARVLSAMDGRGGWHRDMVQYATGLSSFKVGAALMELELAGAIEQEPWGYYAPKAALQRSQPEYSTPHVGLLASHATRTPHVGHVVRQLRAPAVTLPPSPHVGHERHRPSRVG
jgi:hypothetical protein